MSTDQAVNLSDSILHKLKRIKGQELFRNNHLIQFKSLTKRELEIVTHLVMGLNNPDIARQLFISRNTVEQHRKNIKRKLEVKSFSEIFQYALAFNLI
jgi:DNA-binding NarL/FixJ family response regulator